MQDDEIISLFFARSEDAIRQLDVQYGRTCRSLSHNILGSWQDAEECVNDAYLGAWNTIPPQKPSPLLAYICKIVRNLSLRRFRDKMALKRNAHFDVALQELEGCLPSSDTLDDQIDAKELAAVIKQFLDSLTAEQKGLYQELEKISNRLVSMELEQSFSQGFRLGCRIIFLSLQK